MATHRTATVAIGVAVFAGVLGSTDVYCELSRYRHSKQPRNFIGEPIDVFGTAAFILPLFVSIVAVAPIAHTRHSPARSWIA